MLVNILSSQTSLSNGFSNGAIANPIDRNGSGPWMICTTDSQSLFAPGFWILRRLATIFSNSLPGPIGNWMPKLGLTHAFFGFSAVTPASKASRNASFSALGEVIPIGVIDGIIELYEVLFGPVKICKVGSLIDNGSGEIRRSVSLNSFLQQLTRTEIVFPTALVHPLSKVLLTVNKVFCDVYKPIGAHGTIYRESLL